MTSTCALMVTRGRDDDDAGAAFRRRAAGAGLRLDGALRRGGFAVDLDRYEVTVQGRPVDMSPTQIELLAVFLAAPNRVWSRQELNELTGGDQAHSRRIDVRLARLRHSLGADVFRSVLGRGWILRISDQVHRN